MLLLSPGLRQGSELGASTLRTELASSGVYQISPKGIT